MNTFSEFVVQKLYRMYNDLETITCQAESMKTDLKRKHKIKIELLKQKIEKMISEIERDHNHTDI